MGTADFLAGFKTDRRSLQKYIIGTISSLDSPMSSRQRIGEALKNHILGFSFEDIQKERDEILSASAEDICNTAEIFKALECRSFCSVAPESAIDEAKELFEHKEALI